MVNRTLQKLKLIGQKGLDILFQPAETVQAKWMTSIFLMILFVGGILHWGYFLNWFNNRFDLGDWHNIVDPILVFLSNAIRSGRLPLHGSSPLFIPDRYLGRPDRALSPQLLLLDFVNPATYVLINLWIFFAIGFASLLLIRRRYQLSLVSFVALFLLFNFNGHITAHYAVGHMEWVGYFILPCFVLLVLHMLEGGKTGWEWVSGMALTMLAINLQGAVQFFLWCMAFLLLLAIFQPRFWIPAIKAILASLLLSMLRLLPLAIQYYNGGRCAIHLRIFIRDPYAGRVCGTSSSLSSRYPVGPDRWLGGRLLLGIDRFSFCALFWGYSELGQCEELSRHIFSDAVYGFFLSRRSVPPYILIPPSLSWTPNVLQPALLSSRWFS